MRGFSLFFILALAVVCISEINAQRRCRRNEVWTSCGTACPPTCRNPRPRICTRQCVRGCFCRRGWFRNNRGICVARC
ncbi:chymotrypsin inhibitor-like [Fopius arisanus]|uniref:Chymotrypsin inhibitor-like n=1 Tax=Fopius arisanus TaxID=64838 RepID=A0A9R1TWM5_9HYME|nr:PREDICTED: chymotrypsin inhibitor-like [Fopius arisanus]